MRKMVKHLLKKYKYPPEDYDTAISTVISQCEMWIDNNDRYQMVIVGGSAFILLGKLTRATHDIDALSVPKELYSLLGKYDIYQEYVER